MRRRKRSYQRTLAEKAVAFLRVFRYNYKGELPVFRRMEQDSMKEESGMGRKTLVWLLLAALTMSLLAGCQSAGSGQREMEPEDVQTTDADSGASGEAEAVSAEEEAPQEEDVPAWSQPNGTAEPEAVADRMSMPRIIITQDGEVDDINSLVRTLLYADDLDIAGIVQTSSQYHYSGDGEQAPYRWMGTQWMYDMLDSYAECYPNLSAHDPNYPTAEDLRAVTVVGNVKLEGEMEEVTEGSELIRACILDDDPRTLNIAVGGGANTVARALKSIEEEYADTAEWDALYEKICGKVVLAAWGAQDNAYETYISQKWPGIPMLDVSGASGPIGYSWGQTDISMSARKKLEGSWMYEHLEHDHGPLLDWYVTWGDGTHLEGEGDSDQFGDNEALLGSLDWWGGQWMGLVYNRYDFLSEGDSPDWIRALDNGLRAGEDMTYGGWGGRYVPAGYEANPDAVYYASAPETSMADWMEAIQNDFATRADWCVTPAYRDANHAPTVNIAEGLDFTAAAGEQVSLSAVTGDPDGDMVSYHWRQYAAADTYDGDKDGAVRISHIDGDPAKVAVTVPADAQSGDTIHVILEVRDNGEHSLSAYQRIIITVM